jgi:hypothetical protein
MHDIDMQATKRQMPCLLHNIVLQEVLASQPVAPVTTKLECAKLADGAACLLLVPGQAHQAAINSRGA